MKFSIVFVLLVSAIASAGPQPHELVGGMNPEFGNFIPPTPIVQTSGTGDASVDNYPRMSFRFRFIVDCGVYESKCYDRLVACKVLVLFFMCSEEVYVDLFRI